jgi:ribonuclease P protein component
MIAKKFRLTEREAKRVLQKWKPFFSWGIVLNKLQNCHNYNRFAIVISSKSVNFAVERNFFRRRFYDFCYDKIFIDCKDNKCFWSDFVFVIKQKTKLDMKNEESVENFKKDLKFLVKKCCF